MFDLLGKFEVLASTVIQWTRPRPTAPGGADGRRSWIDEKLTQDERRCVLAHEAVHLKHGHRGCQPPAIEREVCLEAAIYLINFQDLKSAVRWSTHPAVIAEELGVTEHVVIDRLQTLDGDELQELFPPGEHIA
ncbi:ImmA/IrrE family metallo-endopeptidase [Glutamicibacter sp.]|uniref:ImmA/IrrE family metallo-endopeptidase n=1 Tax=Glutamicibacter sp. TaxID=1931995 RepID=UPI0028BF2857|nr:ImmA/IrrE family metallo-endopeptidase [Glutamicibacter sp.]